MANTSVGQFPAGKYGNSEGNCATPALLYESGLDFMAQQAPEAPLLYFTGDFAEAGASYPCVPAEGQAGAEQQILDVISYDYKELRKRFKDTPALSPSSLPMFSPHAPLPIPKGHRQPRHTVTHSELSYLDPASDVTYRWA